MLVGDPSIFAIESEINCAYERLSLRALGYFVVHVLGHSYGIRSADAAMLAQAFDQVGVHISCCGTHTAPFAEADATETADAVTRAIYIEHDADETFFGTTEAQFTNGIYSNNLMWGDLDEAFDDGSYLLQFDVGNRVRIIAFQRSEALVDRASIREAWLSADDFYNILRQWHVGFLNEWASLPKSV